MKHISGCFDMHEGVFYNMSSSDYAFTDVNGVQTEILSGAYGQAKDSPAFIAEDLRAVYTLLSFNRETKVLKISQDSLGGNQWVYFLINANKVFISTSLRIVIYLSSIPTIFDTDAAKVFVHHGFIPDSRTLIKGIYKLEPLTELIVSVDGLEVKQLRKFNEDTDGDSDIFLSTEQRIADEYIDIWKAKTASVMALSGGFDSNFILDRAIRKNYIPHVITVGENSAKSEHHVVERICSVKGVCNLSIAMVGPHTMNNYGDIVQRLEGSVFEPGIFLQYELAKKARAIGAEYMICGECADQVFNANFYRDSYFESIDFKFGNDPFELASGVIIKKNGILLNSFGINGIYPYCDLEMIKASCKVRKQNEKTKNLHIDNCRRSLDAEHFKLLNKVGGSTSLNALFSNKDDKSNYISGIKGSPLFRELSESCTRRYGPEYEYDLLDCLCIHYLELFCEIFCKNRICASS